MQMIYWAQKINTGKCKYFAAEPCPFVHNYHLQRHNSRYFMFLLFPPLSFARYLYTISFRTHLQGVFCRPGTCFQAA